MSRVLIFLRASITTLFLVLCLCSFAQQQQADTAGKKQINILQSLRLNLQKTNDTTELQSLAGNVIVRQQNTTFYCDSAILNKRLNTLEAFGHVHINDADSVNTYSDYLRYMGRERKAYLKNNVKLTDGKGTLTTPELEYDVQNKEGIYTKGGRLVNGNTVLNSTEGYYYGETRDVYFKKNVVLVNPEYTVKTDTLLYNTYTDIATFVVPTVITSGARKISTKDGYYDLRNKKAYFGKRPVIQDSTTTLIADEVANDDTTGFGEASGHAIYKDTAQGLSIRSDNLKSNRKKSSVLATIHPVMIIKEDSDSLFVAADTLFSARLSDIGQGIVTASSDSSANASDSLKKITAVNKPDSSKDRFFEAWHHVRIFSDSLQAACDSLFYSAVDSVFKMYGNPVVWANENQITGDTIYLYTKNKKPQRMYVFENALAISRVTDSAGFFNQLKGRTINAYFKNGEIDFTHAKGNAESIYYGLDEHNKFIGVNKSTADAIDMYFINKKPQKVVFRSGLKGTAYPMRQVNHEDLKIRGFKWQEDRRPKTKYELLDH